MAAAKTRILNPRWTPIRSMMVIALPNWSSRRREAVSVIYSRLMLLGGAEILAGHLLRLFQIEHAENSRRDIFQRPCRPKRDSLFCHHQKRNRVCRVVCVRAF